MELEFALKREYATLFHWHWEATVYHQQEEEQEVLNDCRGVQLPYFPPPCEQPDPDEKHMVDGHLLTNKYADDKKNKPEKHLFHKLQYILKQNASNPDKGYSR